MKKTFIMITLAVMILFQGCGGVAQEEYDKVVAEKEEISKELETVQKEMEEKLETVTKDYEKANQEKQKLLDEKAEKAEAEMELSVPKAWATTYFGDDCIILAENKEYLQIVSKESYTVSLESVQKIFDLCKQSMAGLAVFLNDINYERIGIKFQQADGKELLEFVLKADNGTYTLESITGDLENSAALNAAFNRLT